VTRRTRLLLAVALVLAAAGSAPARAAAGPYGVGEIVVRYVDDTRTVDWPGEGDVPRTIPTVIRYPVSAPGALDVWGAQPASGPFPLVVFAHGFAVTPGTYQALMRAWVQAGYIVAAPFFPLTNANAPGGPDESDLVNQPGDMSLVITRVLAASAQGHGVLAGLVNPSRIAVAGQSDGASTALDTADDHRAPDRRVDAAVILSGADLPGMDSFPFAVGSPPVLAVQGTADKSNLPVSTYRWFRLARSPKFLLTLVGAGHLSPYRTQPQLGIVQRETIAFLDRYLRHLPGARARMWAAGNVSRLARLTTHAP
jgi:dienelactone hydrolase